jgi:catechol 2,3-dioxygenase-like lactoylglutathione lyase family enzyme
MITNLDHVMIAVRDLDTAIDHYQRLGFHVTPGRTQKAFGTHNAFIQLGFTYIELISTFDPVRTMTVVPDIDIILNILDQRDGAMVGFALTSTDIQEEIERLADTGLVVAPHYTIKSEMADGPAVNMKIFMPGGFPWRRPWPFLYQWDTSGAQHTRTNKMHANGTTEITRVSVGVRDLPGTRDLYQHKFGLALQQQDELARLDAHRASFKVGNSCIDLLTPHKEGLLQKELTEIGDGVFEIFLAVSDLKQSRAFLRQQGIEYTMDVAGPNTLMISQEETFGTRCILTQ